MSALLSPPLSQPLLAGLRHSAATPQQQHQAVGEVYCQLRRIARRERRRNPSLTLNTTALVHEAWLKLAQRNPHWHSQEHYLATAALAIRQLLVDYARYRNAQKRTAPELDDNIQADAFNIHLDEVLAIDQALQQLAQLDPRLVHLVELRFFAGLPLDQVASCLGISARTAARDWQRAKAYLQCQLDGATALNR